MNYQIFAERLTVKIFEILMKFWQIFCENACLFRFSHCAAFIISSNGRGLNFSLCRCSPSPFFVDSVPFSAEHLRSFRSASSIACARKKKKRKKTCASREGSPPVGTPRNAFQECRLWEKTSPKRLERTSQENVGRASTV